MATYRENPKHKRGARGGGPPRWFPDTDSICPDDVTLQMARRLLDTAVDGSDPAHPAGNARYAVDDSGRFYKAYSEDGAETWHGYPIREDLVKRQIPARVLRKFRDAGLITKATYKKLLGDAK